jgi:dephospho-CoA kinase
VLRVGLTGGIGSGKSEVTRRLAARGAVIIDADAAARDVVEPGTTGLAAVAAAFGPQVLRPDGALDRDRLGEIVFADPAARARLEAIIHPLVRERMREREATAPPEGIVVHAIPLLAESGLACGFDVVVVVDAPVEVQAERLIADRGMTRDAALARIRAQADRSQRLALATFVVDNSGSLVDLDRQVDGLWAGLQRRASTAAT